MEKLSWEEASVDLIICKKSLISKKIALHLHSVECNMEWWPGDKVINLMR